MEGATDVAPRLSVLEPSGPTTPLWLVVRPLRAYLSVGCRTRGSSDDSRWIAGILGHRGAGDRCLARRRGAPDHSSSAAPDRVAPPARGARTTTSAERTAEDAPSATSPSTPSWQRVRPACSARRGEMRVLRCRVSLRGLGQRLESGSRPCPWIRSRGGDGRCACGQNASRHAFEWLG